VLRESHRRNAHGIDDYDVGLSAAERHINRDDIGTREPGRQDSATEVVYRGV
jgi:hypothetical protein